MAGKLIIPRRTVLIAVLFIGILLILISFFIYAVLDFIVVFDPSGDWNYIINRKYSISYINHVTIVMEIIIDEYHTEPIFFGHITKFRNNERFICFRGIEGEAYEREQTDNNLAKYFIFDMSTEIIYGPYSDEASYLEKYSELGVRDTCEWISTDERPEEAFGYSIRERKRLKKYLNE